MNSHDPQQLNQQPKNYLFVQVWITGMREVFQVLPPAEIQLVIALAFHMKPWGYCFPTQSILAKEMNISEQAVRKRLSKLKKRIFRGEPMIQVVQARNTNRIGREVWNHNTYQFSKPMLEAISFGKKSQPITTVTKVDTENIINSNPIEPMLANNDKNTVVTPTVGGTSNYKQDPITNNKEQQRGVVEIKSQLIKWDMDSALIDDLVKKYPIEKIEQVIQSVKRNPRIDSKAGFVISALKRNFNLETQAAKEEAAYRAETERARKEAKELSKPREEPSQGLQLLQEIKEKLTKEGRIKST